jgi:hypothetical protein
MDVPPTHIEHLALPTWDDVDLGMPRPRPPISQIVSRYGNAPTPPPAFALVYQALVDRDVMWPHSRPEPLAG